MDTQQNVQISHFKNVRKEASLNNIIQNISLHEFSRYYVFWQPQDQHERHFLYFIVIPFMWMSVNDDEEMKRYETDREIEDPEIKYRVENAGGEIIYN